MNLEISRHPLYGELHEPLALRFFMEAHVWAVWDFMSLLKRLQRDLTCVALPWRPSPYPPELVRLINQIVLGEESDLDQHGRPCSHFALYLRAMEEVGADTRPMAAFLRDGDLRHAPAHSLPFVVHTLSVAEEGETVEVAAAFFHGREEPIPDMFIGILAQLPDSCHSLRYYLQRHVELDGDEHGPMGERCLQVLCGGEPAKAAQARAAGDEALRQRAALWDRTLAAWQTSLKSRTHA